MNLNEPPKQLHLVRINVKPCEINLDNGIPFPDDYVVQCKTAAYVVGKALHGIEDLQEHTEQALAEEKFNRLNIAYHIGHRHAYELCHDIIESLYNFFRFKEEVKHDKTSSVRP